MYIHFFTHVVKQNIQLTLHFTLTFHKQCQARITDVDQRVGHLETMTTRMEGRQEAITNEYKRELTMLSQDVNTAKTVTNALVEDNVKMEGKIRILQGWFCVVSIFVLCQMHVF